MHEAYVHEAYVREAYVHEAYVYEAYVHEAYVREAYVREAYVHEAWWARCALPTLHSMIPIVESRLSLTSACPEPFCLSLDKLIKSIRYFLISDF